MIEISDMVFGYRKNRRLLDGISAEIPAGTLTGLFGCNGVGKTTLLKILTGLLIPSGGSVRIDGSIPGERRPSLSKKVIFIPEEFDLPHVTFETFCRRTSVFYPDFSPEMLGYYSQELGIDRTRYLDRLSMGERKRAYIGFALSCRPQYLFMDEPTNGLDIRSKRAFRNLLSSFITPQRTIIISTHQAGEIQNFADIIMLMDSGEVLCENTQRLSRLLKFGPVAANETALWHKETLTGKVGITANHGGEESTVDLEMLLSALAEGKISIQKILENKTAAS